MRTRRAGPRGRGLRRWAWLALGVIGCGPPPATQSALVETDRLFAAYVVTTDGDGTTVASAAFHTVDGDAIVDVVLGDGDAVAVDGVPLEPELPTYPVRLAAVVPSAPEHTFAFERPGRRPIHSRVASATPFALTSGPFDGDPDLEATLTWAPTLDGATIDIAVLGEAEGCGDATIARDRADTGTYAFTGADLPAGDPSSCTYVLEVARDEVAPLEGSPLAGGDLVGRHVDSTAVGRPIP